MKQYNSKFITQKIPPGAYTFKDLSIVLSRAFNNEFEISARMRVNHKQDIFDSVINDSDNVSSITKLRLGPQIMVLRFDKKNFKFFNKVRQKFFNNNLCFSPYSDYKKYIGDNDYYGGKKLSIIDTYQLKCDLINGSVVNGIREPILFSFVINKASGFKIFCEPETIHYRKVNESVLNIISFCRR